jgi:hypothetical protein
LFIKELKIPLFFGGIRVVTRALLAGLKWFKGRKNKQGKQDVQRG